MEDYNENYDVGAQPEAQEVISREVYHDTDVDTNVETPQETQPTQTNTEENIPRAFKVKHLHEEKEISYDEAPTYIQKGLDYDRVKEKYESSKPVLNFVEQLAKDNGMTVEGYLKAVEEYQEQERVNALVQQNIPQEYAKEILENRKFREQFEQEKQSKQKETQQQQEYQHFFEYFANENGRNFDTVNDTIPQEVWDLVAKGKSLTDAYQLNERNILKAKLRDLETLQEIKKTNNNLAQSSPGAVTGQGNNNGDVLTKDYIENHMSEKEMIKRWPEVKKILGMK